MKTRHVLFGLLLLAAQAGIVFAAGSPIKVRPGTPPDDAVWRAILDSGRAGPVDIFEVRRRLASLGGELETHIVGNRGFHNPEAGSFSFFESYSGPMPGGTVQRGELFIGFFSERQGDKLTVQQSFDPGLMIELIGWDYTKKMFGFWELVGKGGSSEWNYRGDSADILADIERIDTGDANPRFGQRLRCSGCHSWGGPILKELEPPHNDWWSTEHRLPLGTMKPDGGEAERLLNSAMDAWNLGRLVKVGTARMIAARSQRDWDGQSTKQRLRPLFFTVEMNLINDARPFESSSSVEIPAAFFVDSRLSGPIDSIQVSTNLYKQALTKIGSRFAADEIEGQIETRHAHLVPARSFVDDAILDRLVTDGLLDAELVADCLAVDFTTPVYSGPRSSLVRYLPNNARDAKELAAGLIETLKAAPQDPAARELLLNLTDSTRTAATHRERALSYVEKCRAAAGSLDAVIDWLKVASQRRLEVAVAESSRSPRGTILEPGFRVIFPQDKLGSKPGRLMLDPATGRARAAAAPLGMPARSP